MEEGYAQLLDGMARVEAHAEATGRRVGMLMDLLESEEAKDAEDLRRSATFFRRFSGFLDRIAILTASQVHYGMSRMWAVHMEGSGIAVAVFQEEGEALRWLAS